MKQIQRKLAALISFLLVISVFVGCGDSQPETDSIADAYLKAAQEQIDAGNPEVAIQILEEGITKSNSPALVEKLDALKGDHQPTAGTDESTPAVSTDPEGSDSGTAPNAQENQALIDQYVGLWSHNNVQMEIARNDNEITLHFAGITANDQKLELTLTASCADISENTVTFPFSDDGFGNSGTLKLMLKESAINYVIADYTANGLFGLGTEFPGGTVEPHSAEPEDAETAPSTEAPTEATQPAATEPEADDEELEGNPVGDDWEDDWDYDSDDWEIYDYSGKWGDSYSQRAFMNITKSGDAYCVSISWASSASETTMWTMTARDAEGGSIFSNDCVCVVESYLDDGSVTSVELYRNGMHQMYIEDGILYWDDFVEGAGANCTFERID